MSTAFPKTFHSRALLLRPGLVGLLLLQVCSSSAAWANDLDRQVAEDRRRANLLYQRANRLNERGMYGPALTLYHQARRLYPSYKIDLNIGGVLDAMGRITDAATYFHQFLVNSVEAPEEITRIARERLDELKQRTGSVTVSGLVDGAAVRIGGISRGLTPLVIPVYLEPGEYKVEVQKKGFETFATTVKLDNGQHVPLELPLDSAFIKKEAKEAAATKCPECPAPRPSPEPPACTPGPVPTCEGVSTFSRSRTIGAWTATGIGAALVVTGVTLYAVGMTRGNEAYEGYTSATAPADISAHWDDVESNSKLVIAGQVLLGAAAAAAGTAIYLFATRAREAPAPESAEPGSVTLAPGLGGGSISVTF